MIHVLFCLLLMRCGFQPLYDTADHTLNAGEMVFHIHSTDAVLNNRLQRELKVVAGPLMKKPGVVDIQLNAKQSPVLYDQYGGPRRWHASLNADVTVRDKNGQTLSYKRIWARQSFDHISEQDRLQATEQFEDLLVKDLAQQIVSQCAL